MIALLKGQLVDSDVDKVIVDVSGVGYELNCSQNTLQDVTGDLEVTMFVHTHVREDQITLFGFSTMTEKKLFLSLIKVNGVGPKMAITILGGAHIDKIIEWIENDDAKSLTALPKVGKKTAEQLILSLKGQLTRVDATKPVPVNSQSAQIRSALLNLGYRSADIDGISSVIGSASSVQEGIREALQKLSQNLLGEL